MKEMVRAALKDLIKRNIVVNINGITLSSGKNSTFYYDLNKVALNSIGSNLIADLIIEENPNVKCIGGLERGAIPITMAIIMKNGLSGFVVRKHGLKHIVEGNLDSPVVIVVDVLTTGASLMKALQAVKDEGASVNGVVCVIDREEDNELKRNQIKYTSLFKHSDFKPFIDAEIQRQMG